MCKWHPLLIPHAHTSCPSWQKRTGLILGPCQTQWTRPAPAPALHEFILGSTGCVLCKIDQGIGSRLPTMDQNCHAYVQEVQANLVHGKDGTLIVNGGRDTLQACTTYRLACMHLKWPLSSHCCWCKRLFRSTSTDHCLHQGILYPSKHLALPIPSHQCFNLVARCAVPSTKENISSGFDVSVVKGRVNISLNVAMPTARPIQ